MEMSNVAFILREELRWPDRLELPKEFLDGKMAICVLGRHVIPFEWACHEVLGTCFDPCLTYVSDAQTFAQHCYMLINGRLTHILYKKVERERIPSISLHQIYDAKFSVLPSEEYWADAKEDKMFSFRNFLSTDYE